MKKIIGFLFVMLSLHRITSGQSHPADYPLHQGIYSFNGSRNDDLLARSGNAVVKQLALFLMKAPEKTRCEISYSYRLLYANVKDEALIFGFHLSVDEVSGDVKAGGFDISDALKPGISSFELDLLGGDGQILDTISINRFDPGKDAAFNRTFKVKPELYSLLADVKLKNVRFGYEDKQLISVINRLNAIKAYQAAGMLCDSIQKEADRLNRQTVSPSPEIAFEIFHLSSAVRLLGQLYGKWIKVPGSSDPANLQQKQNALAYRVILIQQQFLKQVTQGKLLLPRKNILGLAQWWVNSQVNFLTEKRFPGYAADVFYKLGKLSFSPPDMDFLNKSLFLMIKALGNEPSPRGYAWALSDAASKVYLKMGAKLIAEGHYNEAAGLLGNASVMCSVIPGATCSDRLFRQQASAYYGTYFSYIGVARKALDNNLPDIASGYVEAAAIFQQENSRFVILNTEVKNLCKRLVDIWMARGNQKQESGRLAAALTDFEKAERASATANSGVASDLILGKVQNLRRQIAKLRQDKSVKTADIARSLDEPDEVFKQLFIADRIFKKESDLANQAYENLKAQLVIQEIERIMKESKSAIANGDCESAAFLLNNSKQMIRDFQLPANTMLEGEFNRVSHAVDSCICFRIKQESLILLRDARRLAAAQCYVPAASVCAQAIKIMGISSFCIPEINVALALRDSLHWPAMYQEMMQAADSLAIAGAAAKSVDLYIQAGEIFSKHRLNKSGIRHPSLIEFSVSKHNRAIYSQAVFLLLRQGNPAESLLLLGRMKAEGYSADDCKIPQEMVAEKFALRDGPEPNLLILNGKLFEYTGDSEWFIYFKKMYLKVIRL